MLDERLANLLRDVVEDYIVTKRPVGSHYAVQVFQLDVSTATVRNDFVALEEQGFLAQPHTSGGRIPTEKGYRQYIDLFVRVKPLSKREHQVLAKASKHTQDQERRIKMLVRGLAELSAEACFVGFLSGDTYYTGLTNLFSQPEFQNSERLISISEVLDQLDATMRHIPRVIEPQPRITLGQSCPFGSACGAVTMMYHQHVIGILGPMRMNYQRTMSLMAAAIDLLQTDYH